MTRNPARAFFALLLVCIVGVWSVSAEATTVKHRTIVDLIALSDIIVSGTVVQVTDGIDANNFPYTEITMSLNETIRGGEKGTFTFRLTWKRLSRARRHWSRVAVVVLVGQQH